MVTIDRAAVAFVHGLFSSSATWNAFRDLLHQDAEITKRFDLRFFDYHTPYLQLHPGRKTPDLDTIAASLGTYLDDNLTPYKSLIFVSHSQGGLVVQRFLTQSLQGGQGDTLRRINGFVMFACPNSGSEFALTLRRSMKVWRHPQERDLRPLAPTVLQTQRLMMERVVYAAEASATHCPLPVIAYAGEYDGIVPPASAISTYPTSGVLPGDHSSIIRPDSPAHPSYVALRGDLLRLHETSVAGVAGSQDSGGGQTDSQTSVRADAQVPAAPQPMARTQARALPAVNAALLIPIVDALLAVDEIADGASRRQVVSYLPPHIRAVVPDAPTPRLHVVALVRTCIGHGDFGRRALEEALALTLGDQRNDVITALSAMAAIWPEE